MSDEAKIRNPGIRLRAKIIAGGVILIWVPSMMVVGLPILLYEKLRKRPLEQAAHGNHRP